MDFDIIESGKLGGNWEQSLAVVRKNEVFLRIVGNGTEYRVMTATAGEDIGGYFVCQQKSYLWEAARELAFNHGCTPDESLDGEGRSYIRLFSAIQDKGVSDKDFTKELNDLIKEFFCAFDKLAAKSIRFVGDPSPASQATPEAY
jgi:predicted RNA-binding protein YlxR (DUF448 family)